MANEIGTHSMIKSRTTVGQEGTECPTKAQIKAKDTDIWIDNESSYADNELVKLEDVQILKVSPTSLTWEANDTSAKNIQVTATGSWTATIN